MRRREMHEKKDELNMQTTRKLSAKSANNLNTRKVNSRLIFAIFPIVIVMVLLILGVGLTFFSREGLAIESSTLTQTAENYESQQLQQQNIKDVTEYEEISTIEKAISENKFSKSLGYYEDELPNVINSRNQEISAKTLYYKAKDKKTLSRQFTHMAEVDSVGVADEEIIHPSENEKVDVEMLIDSEEPVDGKILKLNNMTFQRNITLGVDKLSLDANYIENKAELESYAINLEGVDFTEGELTAVAKGNELWKCALWNFTEQQCMGTWEKIQDIIPGEEYNINLFPGDPGYVETYDFNQSIDVALTALDDETIVIAWINNDTNYYASFEVWNTRGQLLVDQVNFETSGSATSRVDVEAINSTHFILGLIDGPDQDNDFFIYNRSGSQVVGVTQLDATIGAIADVALCELGNRFVVVNENAADSDADFYVRSNAGTSLVAQTAFDGTTSPGANGQNLVDCLALNDTKWVYLFYDDADNDVTMGLLNGSGSTLRAATDMDTDVGETGQIAGAALGNNRFAAVFYDSTDDDITINITQVNSSNHFVNVYSGDIDTDAGTDSRVAAAEVRNSDDAYFVAAWQDTTAGDIKAAVYNRSGGAFTSPFTVTSTENSAFLLLDVIGYSSLFSMGLCNYTFAIAYTNESGDSVFETYWLNGTTWDGRCPEYDPPNVTVIGPSNNTFNKSTSNITFYYNVSDESIVNCTLYVNSSYSVNATNATRNSTLTFNVTLANGNYSWKIGCVDDFGNSENSSLYNLNISWYVPEIQRISTETLIILNAGATKRVDCNATIQEGNGLSDISAVNATLYLVNMTEDSAQDSNMVYRNTSCVNISSSGNTSNYTCSFYLYYYASNGTWNCSVRAYDVDGWIGRNITNTSVDTLYALNTSAIFIDYGDIVPSANSSDKIMNITNYGNMPLNISVKGYGGDNPATGSGYALRCNSGDNITVDNQRYSIVAGTSFSQKKQLTSSAVDLNMTIQKQTVAGSQKTNSSYWQLYIPPIPSATECNGTIVFTATAP